MLIWLPVLCEVSWEGLEAPPSGKHTVVRHGTAGLTARLLLADREVPVFVRASLLVKSVAVGCKDGLKFLLLSSGFGQVRRGSDELVETLRRTKQRGTMLMIIVCIYFLYAFVKICTVVYSHSTLYGVLYPKCNTMHMTVIFYVNNTRYSIISNSDFNISFLIHYLIRLPKVKTIFQTKEN